MTEKASCKALELANLMLEKENASLNRMVSLPKGIVLAEKEENGITSFNEKVFSTLKKHRYLLNGVVVAITHPPSQHFGIASSENRNGSRIPQIPCCLTRSSSTRYPD